MNTPSPTRTSQMVAIVGGTGAGKGWVASRLSQLLGDQACLLSLDDFYRDRSHLPAERRERINFDVPHAIDWSSARQVINDCRLGQPTRVPRYDFSTHSRLPAPAPLQPKPVVLVEGLWLLCHKATRQLFALKIYVDCPAPLRLTRRRQRDVAERGRTADSVDRQFQRLAPFHDRYVEPQKQWADVVLNHPFDPTELNLLAHRLWALLQPDAGLPVPMPETFRAELLTLMHSHEQLDPSAS